MITVADHWTIPDAVWQGQFPEADETGLQALADTWQLAADRALARQAELSRWFGRLADSHVGDAADAVQQKGRRTVAWMTSVAAGCESMAAGCRTAAKLVIRAKEAINVVLAALQAATAQALRNPTNLIPPTKLLSLLAAQQAAAAAHVRAISTALTQSLAAITYEHDIQPDLSAKAPAAGQQNVSYSPDAGQDTGLTPRDPGRVVDLGLPPGAEELAAGGSAAGGSTAGGPAAGGQPPGAGTPEPGSTEDDLVGQYAEQLNAPGSSTVAPPIDLGRTAAELDAEGNLPEGAVPGGPGLGGPGSPGQPDVDEPVAPGTGSGGLPGELPDVLPDGQPGGVPPIGLGDPVPGPDDLWPDQPDDDPGGDPDGDPDGDPRDGDDPGAGGALPGEQDGWPDRLGSGSTTGSGDGGGSGSPGQDQSAAPGPLPGSDPNPGRGSGSPWSGGGSSTVPEPVAAEPSGSAPSQPSQPSQPSEPSQPSQPSQRPGFVPTPDPQPSWNGGGSSSGPGWGSAAPGGDPAGSAGPAYPPVTADPVPTPQAPGTGAAGVAGVAPAPDPQPGAGSGLGGPGAPSTGGPATSAPPSGIPQGSAGAVGSVGAGPVSPGPVAGGGMAPGGIPPAPSGPATSGPGFGPLRETFGGPAPAPTAPPAAAPPAAAPPAAPAAPPAAVPPPAAAVPPTAAAPPAAAPPAAPPPAANPPPTSGGAVGPRPDRPTVAPTPPPTEPGPEPLPPDGIALDEEPGAGGLLAGAALGLAAVGLSAAFTDLRRPAPPLDHRLTGSMWPTQFQGTGGQLAVLPGGMDLAYQQVLAPGQTEALLDGRQDLLSGLVHPLHQVAAHQRPAELFTLLGLGFELLEPDGSTTRVHDRSAASLDVLRFAGVRTADLVVPLGPDVAEPDQGVAGMVRDHGRPWTGTGHAPGSTSADPVEEYEILPERSVPVPHLAEIWRLHRDHPPEHVATWSARSGAWSGHQVPPPAQLPGRRLDNGEFAQLEDGTLHESVVLSEQHTVLIGRGVTAPAEFHRVLDGSLRAVVPAEQVVATLGVSTVADWRGARVQLLRRMADMVLVRYVGSSRQQAAELGFAPITQGDWMPRWLPVAEVGEPREATRIHDQPLAATEPSLVSGLR